MNSEVSAVGGARANAQSPEVAAAIDTVAQAVLYDAAQKVEWGDYPEIGENDWQDVIDRLDELAPHPDGYLEAYDLLEKRAES